MTPDEPQLQKNTFDPSQMSREYRRAQVMGAKKIIKKLRKGMTAIQVAKTTGVSLEAVLRLEGIIKMQSVPLPTAETEIWINGEEVK